MFFWFGPIGFIIPILLIVFGIRFFSKFFRKISRELPSSRFSRHPFEKFARKGDLDYLFEDEGADSGYEAQIFRLAYKLRGRITLSDIVLETGLGVQESEKIINRMVDSQRVRMEVDERGIVVYEFPEIIMRFREGDRF